MLNRAQHGIARVFLTRLGGGAFGNDPDWIVDAMRRAIDIVGDAALDIRIVSYSSVPSELRRLETQL